MGGRGNSQSQGWRGRGQTSKAEQRPRKSKAALGEHFSLLEASPKSPLILLWVFVCFLGDLIPCISHGVPGHLQLLE